MMKNKTESLKRNRLWKVQKRSCGDKIEIVNGYTVGLGIYFFGSASSFRRTKGRCVKHPIITLRLIELFKRKIA